MAHLTPVPDPSPDDTPVADPPVASKPRRGGRILPTERISFLRQLEVLRAFAVAAADGGGTASNKGAGDLIKMSHHTVVLSTPFFVSVGLLSRADRGRFAPVAEVVEYSRAFQWQPDSAALRLAPVLRKSWFGQIITRMVSVQPRDAEDVLTDLAGAAEATPDHRANLELLLEYAVAVGLVQRDGRQVRQAMPGAIPRADAESAATPAVTAPPVVVHSTESTPQVGTQTHFRTDDTEGMVSFDVSVRVRMSDFAGWSPARISAFFGGIASVLAAKGRMEEDAGSGS
jgi:hypothetical protein